MHTNLRGIWRRSPFWAIALGLWGVSGSSAAQNASFSAMAQYTSTTNAISSVMAEISLPKNMCFEGTPSFTANYSGTGGDRVVDGLSLNPGTPTVVPVNATFSRAASQSLRDAATGAFSGDLEAVSAIVRSGAGVNGLD
ncbi:MAG: hypothetical protein HC918_06255 [Oscillatoriales cyanobacterium SM2_1_8]|nr:hypothetical protein [Oscillatoriales cyanobacterium SM2_1_8]